MFPRVHDHSIVSVACSFSQALPSRLGASTVPPIAAARSANTLCEGGREKTRWCTAHSSRNVSRLFPSYSRISSSISCSLSSAATSSRSCERRTAQGDSQDTFNAGNILAQLAKTYLFIDCFEHALKICKAAGRRWQVALKTFAVLEDVQTSRRRHLPVGRTCPGVRLGAKITTHLPHPLLELLVLFERRVISAAASRRNTSCTRAFAHA